MISAILQEISCLGLVQRVKLGSAALTATAFGLARLADRAGTIMGCSQAGHSPAKLVFVDSASMAALQ